MKRTTYTALVWGALILTPILASAQIPSNHQQFIKNMLTYAKDTNQTIMSKRQHLLQLSKQHQQGATLSSSDRAWLINLAAEYKVSQPNLQQASTWNRLLKRVDIIPPSLLIAQAVNESGWGTSHVAREANNYFGQKCFGSSCRGGSRHFVQGHTKTFSNPKESVNSYINNLNTNKAYSSLWDIRWQQRQGQHSVSGLRLAEGLTRYSERGHAYISTIKGIIRDYDLDQLDVTYA